jgi:hypothetical protein
VIATLAIIPSAVIFFLNQRKEMQRNRNQKYEALIGRWREFLDYCISHPELSLESGRPVPFSALGPVDLARRDLMFDKLTSIFEEAYLIYHLNPSHSHRDDQWDGWERYIRRYFDREDYLEWWLRIVLEGDRRNQEVANITEYDSRFEGFMKNLAKPRLDGLAHHALEAARA